MTPEVRATYSNHHIAAVGAVSPTVASAFVSRSTAPDAVQLQRYLQASDDLLRWLRWAPPVGALIIGGILISWAAGILPITHRTLAP